MWGPAESTHPGIWQGQLPPGPRADRTGLRAGGRSSLRLTLQTPQAPEAPKTVFGSFKVSFVKPLMILEEVNYYQGQIV